MLCPICKRNVSWQDNPFRPFCSERCKLIDLDNWLQERYRAPAGPVRSEELNTADGSPAQDPTTNAKGERD